LARTAPGSGGDPHLSCEHGACGACTLIVDGAAVCACLMLTVQASGRPTIERLSSDEALSPLQTAFRKHHALQCGFCTPAMLITARDLIRRGRAGSEREIREGLSGNICRCTGYTNIVAAIAEATAALQDHPRDAE